MNKRTTILLLCLALAGSACSCGSEAPVTADTTASSGGDTTPAEDNVLKSGVPDGKTFDKQAEGIFRQFGCETIVTFTRTPARYVRLDILSTVGADALPHLYSNVKCSIGNLTVFE